MPHRIALVLAALTATAALAAAPASASHIPGATYRGTAATGGTVTFAVSADGRAITRFELQGVPTSCGPVTARNTGEHEITDHAFAYEPSFALSFTGSFPAARQAQGTVSYKTASGCTSDPVAWSAGPLFVVGGSASQRLGARGVVVTASCPAAACTATATGKASIQGVRRQQRLRSASARVAKGATAKLRLRLRAPALRAARRALAKRRQVTAAVTVTVRDAAGDKSVVTRTIRLRR